MEIAITFICMQRLQGPDDRLEIRGGCFVEGPCATNLPSAFPLGIWLIQWSQMTSGAMVGNKVFGFSSSEVHLVSLPGVYATGISYVIV